MRVLVIYSSESGNTEKIAQAVCTEVLLTEEAEIKKINQISTENLNLYDIIFAGSPCHGGDISPYLKNLLDILPGTAKFALAGFITHAAFPDEKKYFEKCFQSFENISRRGDIRYMGCFDCQGKPAPVIQGLIKETQNITDNEWAEILSRIEKHPDDSDIRNAREFARKVLQDVSDSPGCRVIN